MGKKPAARQPSPMWVTTANLPTNARHSFFERLNRVLEEAGFDAFVEGLCAAFYAARMGGGGGEATVGTVCPAVVHRLFRRVVL